MSEFGYPKYGKSQRFGKAGESFINSFVHHKLGWIYRSVHQESDFGIDGYVDIVTNENVTGQTIGIQVKCGDSFFNRKTEGGIRYDGEKKHLNYYLNCPFPIVLVVLKSDCSEGKWVEFNANITSPSKNGWWIEIPEKNVLDLSVKADWEFVAGPVSDNSEKIALLWQVNDTLDKTDFGVYLIHKDDVLSCNFAGLRHVIDRLSRNRESLLKNRGTLEVLIAGYDDDAREAYEIPEIRHWYRKSIEAGIPWFYFLGKQANGMGLIVLLLACCDTEVKWTKSGNTYVEIADVHQVLEWFDQNYGNLNRFTQDKGLPLEINKEMSDTAYALITSSFVEIEGLTSA